MKKEWFDTTFENENYQGEDWSSMHFEACTFKGCNFDGAKFSKTVFEDCSFKDCNLSGVVVTEAAFREVEMKGVKLLGVRFDSANGFGWRVNFEDSQLNYSSFYGLNLAQTRFNHCQLHEVDFGAANLEGAIFDKSDLSGSVFDQTDLRKCDFTTAHNVTVNLDNNYVRGAKFSVDSVRGILSKWQIEIE